MAAQESSLKEKGFSFLLMFVFGFAGMSIIGVIIVSALIALGILPAI